MTSSNTVHLKKLVNNVGFYGLLESELIMDHGKIGLNLIIEDEDALKWESALRFGAEFFYEKFTRENQNTAITITITKIDFQPVDSSLSIFFYLIVSALIKHTNYSINNFGFNDSKGMFFLPK